jgi:hypothetical protein
MPTLSDVASGLLPVEELEFLVVNLIEEAFYAVAS